MPLTLTSIDLVLRLGSAFLAGCIIGYNRGEHGKAAGLRTTVLVCLAASVAMLQVNYLLPLAGRSPDSFVMNDLMRLPLGILTGVGFIGGGAILRRGNFVIGVTTAATLWYVTVIGLCFGGGQLLLGWIATIIGGLVLWCGGWVESKLPVEREAKLSIAVDQSGPTEDVLLSEIRAGGLHVSDLASSHVGANRNLRTY